MILTITMNPAVDKIYAVDDYQVGAVFRPRDMAATAGGKGLNVARAAYILGEEVAATGLAGGSTGRFIEEEVEKQGIHNRFIGIQGESRICINIIDKKNGTSTEILEKGPEITEDEYTLFIQQYIKLVKDCDVVTASGSLPAGLPVDLYRQLVRIAKEKNKKFILDTSGKCLEEGLQEKPYMIKPNMDEFSKLCEFCDGIDDYVVAAKILKSRGIDLPVISLGKHGCIAAIEEGIYHFTTPEVKVINTVGSGDSFVAGCAVGLSRGLPQIEVIKLGMACGTANTQFFKTGLISTGLVEKYLPMIGVERVE